MRTGFLIALLIPVVGWADEPPPEVQIALQSLRQGEKARAEAVLGELAQLPLYRGDFTVDPVKRSVTGKLSLTITSKSGTREVLLRVTPNVTYPGAVVLSNPKVNGAAGALSQPEPSLYRVTMTPPIAAGQSATIELEVKAKVPKLPDGANALSALQTDGKAGDYGAFAVSDDMVSLVGLIPIMPPAPNGRRFEGPSGIGDLGTGEPANFVVSVTVPSAWRVASSGLAMGEVPTGTGQVRFAYGVAAARELPVLLLKNAKVTRTMFGDVEVETVLLGSNAKEAEEVGGEAGKALELLDSKLGPYPFKTLRVVEMRLVSGAGGMEFPGLITISSSLLSGSGSPLEALGLGGDQARMAEAMFGPALKQLLKDTLAFTVDHEVAHQWTAMLVGNDPIAEPLADEPLTQHLAVLLAEWRRGKANADSIREGHLKASYQLHRMMGGEDAKANRPTSDYDSNREYAAMVYGKAPLLFDAYRKVLGDEAWLRALKTYVEQNRYRFVTTKTLTQLAGKQTPSAARQLESLRVRWWEEAHGDEDIGSYDLDGLLSGKGGNTGMLGVDRKALEELERAMKALSGDE